MIGADFARFLDPVLLARDCGIELDPWQADLMRDQPARALLNCSRQSGKSTVTALMGLWSAIYEAPALICIVSPSQRQSAEMLRSVMIFHSMLKGAPTLAQQSVLKCEFANGSRIVALPGTEKTVRGLAGVKMVIIDEASRIEDDLIAAVTPMLMTSKGRLIALSTPNGRQGFFYEQFTGGDPSWHRTRVPATQCPRLTKEDLDAELKLHGPTVFSQEYGLEFIELASAVFPMDMIERAFSDPTVSPLWA